MTNPKPSLNQCLVLHQIQDGEVWHDGHGNWWARGSFRDHRINGAIEKLYVNSYIRKVISVDGGQRVELMPDGLDVIRRRPLHDLLEALNRR